MPSPTPHIDADLIVIGYGKGGKTLAAALGKQGRRVVMIERSELMYGGTCINIGCVPTKSMVFQAEELAAPSADAYRAAVATTAALTEKMRAANYALLDTIPSVEILTGEATLVDPHTVTVRRESGTTTVTGSTIVIGTGAQPNWPEMPGIRDNPRAVTSTELLTTPELPRRLVVLGGGYVGLEFAAMYAAYGSEVTVLERHPTILGQEDDDIASCAADLLASAGVRLVTGATVTGVDGGTVGYEIDGQTSTVEADIILVAAGRHPVTAGLNLDRAGVTTRSDGSIAVDDHLRTSQPHIFAVGDVNGGPQFTYVSLDDHRIVLDALTGAGGRSTADRRAVPYVLFMTPPLARVGLTERAAVQAGHRIRVASVPVAQLGTVPRAPIVHQPNGLMKVVVDADSDQILGAALLSYDSHEVINIVALAIRHGIPATALRDEIYTHPSMTEAFNQLLGSLGPPR